MRYVGRINEWNDERGFGFVSPKWSRIRSFIHVTDFPQESRRPSVGAMITYEIVLDDKGRFKASHPRFIHRSPRIRRTAQAHRAISRCLLRKGIAACVLIAIAAGCWTSHFPASLALVYACMSALAFVMYGLDKSAAIRRRWRIAEAKLHFIGMLGGWPGALFAQEAFQHKTSKPAFQTLFWITVILNCAALCWLLSTGHLAVLDRAMIEAIATQDFRVERAFAVDDGRQVDPQLGIRITPLSQ